MSHNIKQNQSSARGRRRGEKIKMRDYVQQTSSTGLINYVIEKLIEERLFKVVSHLEGKHNTLEKELISLSNEIREAMGSEQYLFMKYEEISSTNEDILLKDAYETGFNDGINLLKEMLLK